MGCEIALDGRLDVPSVEVMEKQEDPRTHSKRRLKERYNINATDEFIDSLTERIVLGHAIRSNPLKNGSNKVEIKFIGRRFLLIFSPHRLQIMTFLPLSDIRKQKQHKKPKEQTSWKRRRLESRPSKKSRSKRVAYKSLLNN